MWWVEGYLNSDQVYGQPLLESAGQGGKNLEKQVGTKLLSFRGLSLFTQNRGAFQNGMTLRVFRKNLIFSILILNQVKRKQHRQHYRHVSSPTCSLTTRAHSRCFSVSTYEFWSGYVPTYTIYHCSPKLPLLDAPDHIAVYIGQQSLVLTHPF